MALPRNYKALPPKKVKKNAMSKTRKNETSLFCKQKNISKHLIF